MIREANFTDLDRIMHIWLTASEVAHDFITKEYWREKYTDVKEKQLQNAKTFVYEEGGVILGFVSIIADKYLGAIFIDINHQQKGIGRKLTDFIKGKYNELSLVVYEKNTSAIDFYKKNGFEIIKTQVDANTSENECVMHWKK